MNFGRPFTETYGGYFFVFMWNIELVYKMGGSQGFHRL